MPLEIKKENVRSGLIYVLWRDELCSLCTDNGLVMHEAIYTRVI